MHRYAIGLGSNRGNGRCHDPRRLLVAALDRLAADVTLAAVSPIVATAALGPSRRRFANAAVLIETPLDPPRLLALLKRLERSFGRRRGLRWGARPLDLDILLWSGGRWQSAALSVPHPALAHRAFVLGPLGTIARDWRLPKSPLRIGHLEARLTRAGRRA
jgi:2-amino-4-hydroxy-6-hydroxymethyldihydropteridine diphosphokinase